MADVDRDSRSDDRLAEVFRVLGDRVRLSILRQLAEVDELSCASLESTLPVSKPTISYHTKLLRQAGLISVRKQGRNYFYRLDREAFRRLTEGLAGFGPHPRLLVDGEPVDVSSLVQRHRDRARSRPVRPGANGQVVSLLTW
ncbi:MAG: metalloregulator ArsR/SmtB family transcription factor [Actinomycetota bacterium]|nr:metalloregulator ArsR/SmtB family transcription factor [Actinomycetota bacterium]